MKKKVVFDIPANVVSISEVNFGGFFTAEKNGFIAILTTHGTWLDIRDMSVLANITGKDRRTALILAKDEGCTVTQYDSFFEFCEDYVNSYK